MPQPPEGFPATEETELSQSIRQHLGLACVAYRSDSPLPLTALSPGEKALYETLTHPNRQTAWRTGRSALKAALQSVALPTDTALITWPYRQASLSHTTQALSEGPCTALAVATASPIAGLGLDMEPQRVVQPQTARFFLTDVEQQALETFSSEARPDVLLRLWTVKEAVFKADPCNAGRVLRHYQIADLPTMDGPCWVGCATHNSGDPVFRFLSLQWESGYVAVAIHGETA
jgi:4'-phosphopantetheinyl transferase EntD